MSHFTVLVIGENPEKQLAPYHEFECTGRDDEYVQDIDKTEELRKEFSEHTVSRLRGPDGKLHSFFDERGNWRPEFSRPKPERFDESRHERFVPEGYEEVKVPSSEVETFAEFVEGWSGQKVVYFGQQPDLKNDHKYGYVLTDEAGNVTKVIDRTNPNKKWDWYALGGRWTGFFKLKEAYLDGYHNAIGRPGLMTEPAKPGHADQCLKRAIDFDAMRNAKEQEARARYRKFFALLGEHPFPQTFQAMREANPNNIEAARTAYWAQPGIEAVKGDDEFNWDIDRAEFACTEDEHAEKARERTGVTFAVIKDGQWYEKGRMGWWGCVAHEKEQDSWNREVSKLLDSVSGDTLLSVYDCHI